MIKRVPLFARMIARTMAMLGAAVFVCTAQDGLYAQYTPDIELWLGERIGRFGDFEFSILGGRPDYPTPTGAFVVEWKSRSWWSKQWNAPMPYSVFFRNGAAIHEGSLSVPSHGCIHVNQKAARYIFENSREGVTRVFVYP
ncbi:MAG: L,D-transpeptidase [Candidatus Sumerlaeaceae bacterium]|jgi:lipoprotein-anchoring transpeptidase ErfK/SrfK